MTHETELKLALDEPAARALRRHPLLVDGGATSTLDNVYFDTPDRRLASHQMALRARRNGRHWVQTLKTEGARKGALSTRGEWETATLAGRVLPERLADTPLGLLAADGPLDLQPLVRTTFRRTVWTVVQQGVAIEVALDRGTLRAGDRVLPLLELELELKGDGSAADLLRLALLLSHPDPARPPLALLPAVAGKSERAFRLLDGAPAPVVKAGGAGFIAGLDARATAADAVRHVVEHGCMVLCANAAAITAGGDPEPLHQARVALRRVRSALRLLASAALPPGLDGELRWLSQVLGRARDWDVQQAGPLAALLAAASGHWPEPVATAHQRAVALHAEAHAAARAALASPRCSQLLLRLLLWAAAAEPVPARALRELAPDLLERQRRRLRRGARTFATATAGQRHRVRIEAKRLRYALDVLLPVLPARRAAAMLQDLAALQDELGAMNDAAVMAAGLAELAPAAPLQSFALGWMAAVEQLRLPAAQVALQALAGRRRAWKRPQPPPQQQLRPRAP